MKGRWRALVLLAVVSAVLASCSSADESPRPGPTKPTVATPLFPDEGLRPVRMTSGRALRYTQPETASQILCQLLDEKGWERLLDGEIGRRPDPGPQAACSIATEHGVVTLWLLARDDALRANTTVAGRPATVAQDSSGQVDATVALTDDATRAAPRQYYPVRRLLELKTTGHGPGIAREVADRVLAEVIPLLTREGDALPEIDDLGHVRYAGTQVTSEFVDLPTPVQALQLCTLATRAGVGATITEVRDDGECRIRIGQETAVLSADHLDQPADYPARVAGRPARTQLEPPVVKVRLRDDAGVELYVSAPDSRALAEKLVPELVG